MHSALYVLDLAAARATQLPDNEYYIEVYGVRAILYDNLQCPSKDYLTTLYADCRLQCLPSDKLWGAYNLHYYDYLRIVHDRREVITAIIVNPD